ncbi:MAG: hypothetical protein IJF96_02175 [Firmicutes bacterium]|nr:hypothetical protein [Bacillota bacterium]
MKKSEKEKLFEEVFGYRKPEGKPTGMDKVFTEVFGKYAEYIYLYVGDMFNWEVMEQPDIYVDNEKAEENKRGLLSSCIVDRFQLDNSPFYE